MEEAAPGSVSTASMRLPTEVFKSGAEGAPQAEAELTQCVFGGVLLGFRVYRGGVCEQVWGWERQSSHSTWVDVVGWFQLGQVIKRCFFRNRLHACREERKRQRAKRKRGSKKAKVRPSVFSWQKCRSEKGYG